MGVFDRLFEAVAADPDLEWPAIDATVIRAHAQAAGVQRKRGYEPRAQEFSAFRFNQNEKDPNGLQIISAFHGNAEMI